LGIPTAVVVLPQERRCWKLDHLDSSSEDNDFGEKDSNPDKFDDDDDDATELA